MENIHVAAGILRDAAGRILIAERLCDGAFNGLWEFPGGKIGPGESAADALRRELAEELGVQITTGLPFIELRHAYPGRTVDLEFFVINEWLGDPQGLEGQRIRWVAAADLDASELLPADAPVVRALQQQLL